jgi:uncharacterized protein with von Willebrand factor type A (vWA) domain
MTIASTDQPFLANLLHFPRLLRRAGLSISLEQTMDFARALELIDLGVRDQVYHGARGLLVKRKEDFALFDRLFDRFWRLPAADPEPQPQKTPLAPRHESKQQGALSLATLMAQRARQNDPEVDLADRANSYSPTEAFQQKAFSAMTPDELDAVKRLIRAMRWQVSQRQTRRRVLDQHGRTLALRRALRDASKHGGVPIRLSWQSRKIKARPLVVLADISGSMEKYARLLLQFAYSVTQGLTTVESFVFATRLTRITPYLRMKDIDVALAELAGTVIDWSGGTRIGESLQTFNRVWSRRVLRRGAIVLIISDGWERGDAETLRLAVRYLQHRCYRLIWLNPLLGNPAYQVRVEGLSAAIPFIDDFLPIHNLQSLAALSEHLAALR